MKIQMLLLNSSISKTLVFIQQECELLKSRRTTINFDEITLTIKNFVSNATSIQLVYSFQTFPKFSFSRPNFPKKSISSVKQKN